MKRQFYIQYPIVWAILVAGAVALVLGSGVTTSGDWQWSHVETLGTTQAFRASALFHADDDVIIWQPRPADTPLVVQSLATQAMTSILPYPDVNPTRWYAAPALDQTYHIVWLEDDDRLRSALIDTNGATLRGPITLAFRADADFVTVALPDHGMLVGWRNPVTQEVTAQIIDPFGRPDAASLIALGRADQIAAAIDQAGSLHFAWIKPAASGQPAIYYQATDRDHLSWDDATLIRTLDLAPTESITAFALGLDQTHGYVLWSVTTAVQPDHENVTLLAFPLDQPDASQVNDIRLPQQAPSYRALAADTGSFSLDQVRPLAAADEPTAALRWPVIAPGQYAVLSLAFAYRDSDGWRPGVVYVQNGLPLGYQTIADRSADAGPPVVLADSAGQLLAAWAGLEATTPMLYVARLDDHGLVASLESHWRMAYVIGALVGVIVWGLGRYLQNRLDSSA